MGIVGLQAVHTLIQQHPEIRRAQFVIMMFRREPVATGIIGIILAHVDTTTHVLPFILIHFQCSADCVQIQRSAGKAI